MFSICGSYLEEKIFVTRSVEFISIRVLVCCTYIDYLQMYMSITQNWALAIIKKLVTVYLLTFELTV